MDYSDKKVMIGLSAGINSAALLCWVAGNAKHYQPKELHLYYAHFIEHSNDSLKFVLDCVEYAKKNFDNVIYTQVDHSIIEFFEKSKMIPHPAASPCSRILKIMPMMNYMADNGLDLDLVGFVREEKRRATKMRTKYEENSKLKDFPILDESNEWCFDIVKSEIGWYPEIYNAKWNNESFLDWLTHNLYRLPEDVRKKVLKKMGLNIRVFKHNNCLPCKNMYLEELLYVEYFFPDNMAAAHELSERLQKYWGRQSDTYYTAFGRNDYEPQQCDVCQF